MEKTKETPYGLAIESAIGGGSISLLAAGREIDARVGADKVSRAEDLLPNIIEMLQQRSIERGMIGQIAVSLGPGSYTGIRIGLATALGLKDSLNIPCVGVSALEAMALSAADRGTVIAAVPVGRDLICWQIFDIHERAELHATSRPSVGKSVPDELLALASESVIVVHDSIFESVRAAVPGLNIRNVGSNLARLIGASAAGRAASKVLDPIFVSLTA